MPHYDDRPPRLTIRDLSLPQKLLVFVVLATVGFGYLAALANLFAQSAAADGTQTITLAEIPAVVREEGVAATLTKVQDSLGMQDVIARYHGAADKTPLIVRALNTNMKQYLEDDHVREAVIAWSRLPEGAREIAWVHGIPLAGDGKADWQTFETSLVDGEHEFDDKLEVWDVLESNCISCHYLGSEDAPKGLYMDTKDNPEVADLATVSKTMVAVDNGMTLDHLALHTHVHLLGFSVLFTMTGFLFSLTAFPTWLRVVLVPWVLGLQFVEIACWWLAKTDVFYARMIFYLGPLIGIGLCLQIFGTLADLLLGGWFERRRNG